ncbi:MAG: hypothetical protein DMG81_14635 [Acidobacteria bacterium]|nr:MAG: hypothetical protein DMG81_14635 [Acidobacteriota bacterium]
MGKARAGTLALIVVSLPVLVGVFLYGPFVLDLFLHRRPPSRFLIPSGYVGWVRVDYRVATAPPLPREGKYLLVKVARDGSLQTSTDLPSGWGRDQFFYDSANTRQVLSNAGWCKGGMIWGEMSEPNGSSGTEQKFFVGNEDQFRMEVDPAGKMYSPCG